MFVRSLDAEDTGDEWMTRPVLLDELAHPQVKALIEGGMDMVMLPVGAVEQHSLHLPLNVDYLLSPLIKCRRLLGATACCAS